MVAILRVILQRFTSEMLFYFNLTLIITLASMFQLFSLLCNSNSKHADCKNSDAFDHVLLFIWKQVTLTEKLIQY